MLHKRPTAIRDIRPVGFTLVEVLIVVVIISVLAAVVIGRYADSTTDAKQSVLKHNLHILQSQIGLYSVNHFGKYPALEDGDLPQLTHATSATGETGPSGPAYPYGPYVDAIPNNPFNASSQVAAVANPRQKPTGPVGAEAGWQYDEATGDIWPNHSEFFK